MPSIDDIMRARVLALSEDQAQRTLDRGFNNKMGPPVQTMDQAWAERGRPAGPPVIQPLGQGGIFEKLSGGAGYGNRLDATPKGKGYFGELKRPDGDISTELSFDFDAGGKKIFAPLLVPGLTRQEIDHLLAGKRPTPEIFDKAQRFAMERQRAGKPTFAQPGESYPVPTLMPAPVPYRE